jgi:probable phosphoglycerate mutase
MPAAATELLLIRHGETDHNRQGRFQGQVDVPLNPAGRAQAERLAQRLRHEPLDALVSSDLSRARATAEPLRALRGGLHLSTDTAWREQAFGVLEGLVVAQARLSHPEAFAAWWQHTPEGAPPGGESPRAFHARVLAALQALAAAHAGARVAVFTHGGVLDMVWRTVNGLPLSGPRECLIPNTGINRLRWRDGRLELLHWADAAHLG